MVLAGHGTAGKTAAYIVLLTVAQSLTPALFLGAVQMNITCIYLAMQEIITTGILISADCCV